MTTSPSTPPPADSSASPSTGPTTPHGPVPGAGSAAGPRPVGRGPRLGWNAFTAIVGGLIALTLLLLGAGVTTAVALSETRDGSWQANTEIKDVRINGNGATVQVVRSPSVDRATLTWKQTGLGLRAEPRPAVSGSTLSLDVPNDRAGWSTNVQRFQLTLPQDGPAPNLTVDGGTGAVFVRGDYATVTASADLGFIGVHGVQAKTMDLRTHTGAVAVSDSTVRERLDAHASTGHVSVQLRDPAPAKTSITAYPAGAFAVNLPVADYTYPKDGVHPFADSRKPLTTGATVADEDTFPRPAATTGRPDRPRDSRSTGADDAATVCAKGTVSSPCLYLKGNTTPWEEDVYEPARLMVDGQEAR